MGTRIGQSLLFLGLLILPSLPAQATNLCVQGPGTPANPAGGCGATPATLAAAITAAVDGDTIYLHAGQTYTGSWVLPDKNLSTGIVITGDTAAANLPAVNYRATLAHESYMPILQGDANNVTFRAAAHSDHYTFVGLKFISLPYGRGSALEIGSNACEVSACNEFEADEPDTFVIDRCVFVADPIVGQHRWITMGGKNITVKNSSFYATAALGQDSQAIWGINGHGPFTITNNYIEASTEPIMFGGDDNQQRTVMTVTGTPTVSGADVTVSVGGVTGATHTLAELTVGEHLSILINAGAARCHTILRSVTGSGTTGSITFDACAAAPDVPGDIRRGVIPKNVLIRRNYIFKPLRWLDPILAAPTSATATPSTASGSLAAGSYAYRLIATVQGYDNITTISKSTALTASLNATGKVVLSWVASQAATSYRVYGRATSGVTQYWTLAAASCVDGTCTLEDTGTSGTAASSVPSASFWQLKNNFEIKGAASVQMDSNILDNAWNGSDQGAALWIKSVSQYSSGTFNQSRDITLERNLIRHTNGCLVISGQERPDGGTAAMTPGKLTNFTFRQNLCYDSGSAWNLAQGGAGGDAPNYAIKDAGSSVNTIIDHNTIIHDARSFIYLYGGSGQETGLRLTNNYAMGGDYGIFCNVTGANTRNGCDPAPGWTVSANALSGCTSSYLPVGNFCPTAGTWQAQFEHYTPTGQPDAGGPANYALRSDSTYIASGTDGLPLGADVGAVLSAVAGVVEGVPEGISAPPTILTTSLRDGTNGTAYSETLQGSGTGSLSWSLLSGSLPTDLSLSSGGVISGTPSVTETQTFIVRLTDSVSTADQSLSLTIRPAFTSVSITTGATLTAGVAGTSYSVTLAATGDLVPYVWSLVSGSLPSGLSLNATAGTISGIPTAPVAGSFTLRVTGELGTTADRAFSLTVSLPTMPCGRSRKYNSYFSYATFLQPTAPTLGAPDCVINGDSWSDSSKTPPVLNVASVVGGVLTWAPSASAPDTHTILSSTHTDTQAATAQDGDILVYGTSGWHRIGIGPAGSVLTSDGTGVGWTAPTTTTTPTGGTFFGFSYRNPAYPAAWTSQPAAKTELYGGASYRVLINLTNYRTARFFCSKIVTAGSAGAKLWVEYSTDQLTWTALDGSSDGAAIAMPIDTIADPSSRSTAAFTIASGARGLVYLRVVGTSSNGTGSPSLATIGLEIE